jgi:hypothetical protein
MSDLRRKYPAAEYKTSTFGNWTFRSILELRRRRSKGGEIRRRINRQAAGGARSWPVGDERWSKGRVFGAKYDNCRGGIPRNSRAISLPMVSLSRIPLRLLLAVCVAPVKGRQGAVKGQVKGRAIDSSERRLC